MRLPAILDRSLSRLPRPLRTGVDWVATIALAFGFVLAFEAEVAKPYRIPSASMEPTLHCSRPVAGCRARVADRVLVNRVAYRIREPRRGEIVVFEAPAAAARLCGRGGAYVKRIVGLPGETVEMRRGLVSIDGRTLPERYVPAAQRGRQTGTWRVPRARYFLLGDNRVGSCDSRTWGAVSRGALVGPIVGTYWPPTRW